jgi:hypothetical protein
MERNPEKDFFDNGERKTGRVEELHKQIMGR